MREQGFSNTSSISQAIECYLLVFKNIFYTFSAFLLILSLSGCGTKPVHAVEQHAVPSNVQSSEQVKDAIMIAGASLGWIIKVQDKTHL